jgi:hypothetical protein
MSRSRPEERTRPALLEVHGSEEMALIFELSACCMLSTVLSIRDSMGSKTNPVLAYSLKREIDIIKKTAQASLKVQVCKVIRKKSCTCCGNNKRA